MDFTPAYQHFFSDDATSALAKLISDLDTIKAIQKPELEAYVLMSMLELLSQCYVGKVSQRDQAQRLKSFLKDIGSVHPADARLLYHLRNALMHNYGQFTFDKEKNTNYRFRFGYDKQYLFNAIGAFYSVNLSQLNKMVFDAIKRYQNALEKDNSLQRKFTSVYQFIGKV
jgi:hypothetical protein